MPKTPDEIKKGLECCMDYQNCTEGEDPQCPYYDVKRCMEALLADALAIIQQKEQENAEQAERIRQLEAERDALMHWAKGRCDTCAHKSDCAKHDCDPDGYCSHWYEDCDDWEWRGVQKEDSDA